ncbi:MAG: biopolymer transporter ExbD [Verrucomicrobia bacterium]|nr:biopolymer transporter ExbD [Verrucomicrobiota bacterium]
MKLSSGYEHRRARVEMLPLIDVVFILLVFFIYAMLSMVVNRGVNVILPVASTGVVQQQDLVTISVTKDNQLLVNQRAFEIENLSETVRPILDSAGTNRQVFIECDEGATAGLAIRVLDGLRTMGVSEVSFSTREMP